MEQNKNSEDQVEGKINTIRVSKSGVFQIEKFIELYQQHDLSLDYEVFDALRNRFDDNMIEGAFEIMKKHNFKTLILVSRISEMTD